MTNIRLPSIDKYKDVSSKNNYFSYHLKDSEKKRLRRIHLSSRDSSRTPVQWDSTRYAGFSEHRPWFYVNPNYRRINVRDEEKQPDSILNFYRECIRLRSSEPALLYGEYREYMREEPNVYIYTRSLDGDVYLVICSFAREKVPFILPKQFRDVRAKLLITNYPGERNKSEVYTLPSPGFRLYPYEAAVLRIE